MTKELEGRMTTLARHVQLLDTTMKRKFQQARTKRSEFFTDSRVAAEQIKEQVDAIQIAVDLMTPGLYDDDIANLTATLSTLVDSVQGMKKEGMLALADLAASTDQRLKAIDKLLEAYSAPRGMEKRLSDQDRRMDQMQGSIAILSKMLTGDK